MTEFTSAEGLTRKAARTLRYLYFDEDERPIAAQIFGSDPKVMASAAALTEDLGFDHVDINLGCPVKKVVKCGGSGLLRDLPHLEKLFSAVARRRAHSADHQNSLRLGRKQHRRRAKWPAWPSRSASKPSPFIPARACRAMPASADWSIIRDVKQAVKIPVIGNGDIRTPQDAVRMIAETGCDAVMIGRAASSNPWIFRQIADYIATGRYAEPTETDRYQLLLELFPQPDRRGNARRHRQNEAVRHAVHPRRPQRRRTAPGGAPRAHRSRNSRPRRRILRADSRSVHELSCPFLDRNMSDRSSHRTDLLRIATFYSSRVTRSCL